MLSKIEYRRLDTRGVVPFKVKKDLSLEILTNESRHEGKVKTFSENGIFYGELVAFKIHEKTRDGNYVCNNNGVGLMVVNDDITGCWIIPVSLVEPVEEIQNSNDEVKAIVEDEKSDDLYDIDITYNDKNILDKKILGLTIKQLIVITVLAIIIKKI